MADIRIKDLAVTAGSSASDDYLAVDGSTNGTRKLSAYSPTFGGNLTVSGTGTSTFAGNVSSTGNVFQVGAAGSGTGGNYRIVDDGGSLKWLSGLLGGIGARDYSIYDVVNGRYAVTVASSTGNLLIGTTTDGGQKLQVSGTATFKNFTGATGILVNSDSTSATNYPVVQLMHSNPAGYGGRMAVDQNGFTLFQYQSNGGAWTDWLQLNSTTGNATFLSGILSVSVAAGSRDYLFNLATNDQAAARLRFTNSGSGGKVWSLVGGNPGTNNADFTIYDESNALKALVLSTSTGNATFAGSIAIGNTVNTVSPTSPNRTITMVIGGTTYYIHAKTTND